MIGILDWGIGGLDFFRRLRAQNPELPVLYVSDAGYTPYGKLRARELAARLTAIAGHVRSLGVERLVLACNAACTALPGLGVRGLSGSLATPHGALEVTGVVAHAIRLASRSRGVLGVVGGRRTVRSGIYRDALGGRGRRVIQRIAQPLSAHVEAGSLTGAAVRRDLARIVAPLRAVDSLLLACTHYPALAPLFAQQLPGVKLLDPADSLERWVSARWAQTRSGGVDRVLTTGNRTAMRRAAAAAWSLHLEPIERLALR